MKSNSSGKLVCQRGQVIHSIGREMICSAVVYYDKEAKEKNYECWFRRRKFWNIVTKSLVMVCPWY